MSCAQNWKPESPKERPPAICGARLSQLVDESPPQCSGYRWLPAQAERAHMTRSPVTSSVTSATARL
jgi:hypothetical protein